MEKIDTGVLNTGHSHRNKVILFAPPYKPSSKSQYLLTNNAADPLMPSRLYYQVNPHKIVGHFGTMGCIQKANSYYIFLYKEEAKAVCVGEVMEKATLDAKPIIIGYAKVDYKQRVMIFDANSFRRAGNIASFIDYYIPQAAAQLQSVASYNRFIFSKGTNNIRFVAQENYNNISIEALVAQEKQRRLRDYPIVERFPAWAEEDGLSNLASMLQIRLAIARHLSNGLNYSMWDFYQMIASEGN